MVSSGVVTPRSVICLLVVSQAVSNATNSMSIEKANVRYIGPLLRVREELMRSRSRQSDGSACIAAAPLYFA